MGAGYEWKCTACGYKVETSGPHEFYRDTKNRRKPYGHPGPLSQEAAERGIKGFSTLAYCPECDKVKDAVLVEFEKPRDYFGAWGRCSEPSELRCPECGGQLHEQLDHLNCPRCKEGIFEGGMAWIS